jgi:hypothetical protein
MRGALRRKPGLIAPIVECLIEPAVRIGTAILVEHEPTVRGLGGGDGARELRMDFELSALR